MAKTYEAHGWQTRETITAALLNHMEQGIKTAQETANKTDDIQALRAALDAMQTTMQSAIRELRKRLEALENQ